MAATVYQISIEKAGGHNLFSVAEWGRIPSSERVELIMKRKVQFLNDEGDPIPVKEALASLKAAA